VNILPLETTHTNHVPYLATSNNSMAEVTLIAPNSDSRIGLGEMRKFC
jgi:hypothetical protein